MATSDSSNEIVVIIVSGITALESVSDYPQYVQPWTHRV